MKKELVARLATLSLDLGGSHGAVAVVRGTEVLAEASVETGAGALAEELGGLSRLAHECIATSGLALYRLRGVALGFCGIVDGESNEILSTLDKYSDAGGVDLQLWTEQEFGLPLRIENDACMALLGEHLAGAAVGARDVVMITLGTGIGGAAMLGGRLLRSHAGQAGCLGGHLPVNFRGRRCSCGAIGCAESEASTAVLPILCRETPGFSTSLLASESRLDFKALFRAVDAGDSVAFGVLQHCLTVWSALTVGLIHAYGPELVVFGGGVMQRGEALLEPIRAYVAEHTWKTKRGLPRIVAAQLGARAALLGGGTLFEDARPILGSRGREVEVHG